MRIGRNFCRSISFVNFENSTLMYSVEDMLNARSSITVFEMAELLNINDDIAQELYTAVMEKKNR